MTTADEECAEVKRLRTAYQHQLSRALRFKLERDAMTKIADSSPDAVTRSKAALQALKFVEK